LCRASSLVLRSQSAALLLVDGAGERPEFQQQARCLGAVQVAVADDRAVVGALRPRSWGWRSWTMLCAGGPERDGPGARVAVGVAGIVEDVAGAGSLAGHRGQARGEGRDRVVPARRRRGAAGELGDGRARFSSGTMNPGGQVITRRTARLGCAAGLFCGGPGRLRIGAVAGCRAAGAGRRTPGSVSPRPATGWLP